MVCSFLGLLSLSVANTWRWLTQHTWSISSLTWGLGMEVKSQYNKKMSFEVKEKMVYIIFYNIHKISL